MLLRPNFRLVSVVAVMLLAGLCYSQNTDAQVRAFLRSTLGDPIDTTTEYAYKAIDLGAGGPGIVAYVTGQNWCGTGGCVVIVAAKSGDTYRLVSRLTVSRPPIVVLKSRSKGWFDVGVRVAGGGISPGYEAVLEFDGQRYPQNPTVSPAHEIVKDAPFMVLIPADAKMSPLYQ